MKLSIAGAVVCILQTFSLWSQDLPAPLPSYDYLLSQIELYEGTPKVWPYLEKYLARAKRERNYQEAVFAYKEMLHESDYERRFIYADSMVAAAHMSNDADLIGSAYLTRGIAHYQLRQHQKALDDYLVANKHLVSSNDEYLRHKVKYSIGQIKYYLGYYNEAISLFRDCIAYFKDTENVPYLKSLHMLALSYSFTGNYKMADEMATMALEESARLKEKSMLPYIDSAKGINFFHTAQYQQAVKYITVALPDIRKDKDFANEATANFYIGRAYWEMGQKDEAVTHFLEVDRIFTTKNYIRPDLRLSFEYLIKYYHHKDEKDIELQYIDKLLRADSLLGKEFRYLIKKVHKEYDTAELLAEKERIEFDLKRSRWSGWLTGGLAAVFAVVIVLLVFRQRSLQKIHRQRFDELINPSPESPFKLPLDLPGEPDINPAIVESILQKLSKFEDKKGYLKKDLNTNKLAESCDTNAKYLSKVINYYKQKSIVTYINDLRIDYLVERLKNESLLRNYTNGALADEAGFSTAQQFTAAFKKRAKISPGYFVEELNKLPDTPQ
jgi:tetratricopeptide (TPR) repeat protein